VCQRGAREVQSQILERYPDADLRVYVVWLPVMPLDARFDVADLLVDGRATHLWDNEQRVSNALGDAYGSPGRLVWDAYFVFGPDASWDDGPPRPLGSGSPVVEYMAMLESLLDPYLD
jgi:hypothetical protein